jgi:hypothetical protein
MAGLVARRRTGHVWLVCAAGGEANASARFVNNGIKVVPFVYGDDFAN